MRYTLGAAEVILQKGELMEINLADIQAVPYRLVERPAFCLAGRQTFISGPDNDQFERFWKECRSQGWLDVLDRLKQAQGLPAGRQTGGAFLGVSRVEKDPTNRAFNFMIGVEIPEDVPAGELDALGLEVMTVPACRWAAFECHGQPPMSIVRAELFAFLKWLPSTSFRHALAPEMEVYPPDHGEGYAEFWLPIDG
jgi:AraC family transcriptional regulator